MSESSNNFSSNIDGQIRLGLCCINNTLRKKKIFCSRTMIRRNFTVEKAQKLALQNCSDICKLIEWNEKNGIKHLRLSSDIFPHFTDPECEEYDIEFAKYLLKKAGLLAKQYGHRITMHPGQYNQVGAKSVDVFEKTCKDLKMHADILDAMNIDNNGIICVHGGGTYGNKESTMRRWIEQFDDLPTNVRSRLAIENCERQYSVSDCLKISEECKIPVIFDTHHHACYCHLHERSNEDSDNEDNDNEKSISNNDGLTKEEREKLVDEYLPAIIDSWSDKIPLFHISEQASGKRIGAHSDFIENIPQYLFDINKQLNIKLDIEVEAKAKEAAIFKLYEKYPTLRIK